jgi:hypothetical protein
MATLEEARALDKAEPIYLLEVALLNSGPTLRLSDRNVTSGGQSYEDYMEDLSGLGEELRRPDSTGLNSEIELRFTNEPMGAYSHLIDMDAEHPFTGAGVVIKETYLDDTGQPSESGVLFKGALDEPRDIDLMGFTCRASSMEFAADNNI